MAHMTLPAEHSDADCRLAERIGCTLGLDEVHVFWTLPVTEEPEAAEPASAKEPATAVDPLVGLLGALVAAGALLARLSGSVVRRT